MTADNNDLTMVCCTAADPAFTKWWSKSGMKCDIVGTEIEMPKHRGE